MFMVSIAMYLSTSRRLAQGLLLGYVGMATLLFVIVAVTANS